jgi:hypothetical protein
VTAALARAGDRRLLPVRTQPTGTDRGHRIAGPGAAGCRRRATQVGAGSRRTTRSGDGACAGAGRRTGDRT